MRRNLLATLVLAGCATKAAQPKIHEKAIAGMRLFSKNPVVGYEGRFRVTEQSAGRIVGRLENREEDDLEIHYRFLGNPTLVFPKDAEPLATIEDTAMGPLLHRLVHLRDTEGLCYLLYLDSGSFERYDRDFAGGSVRVQQAAPGPDGITPVRVTYSGLTCALRPGETARIRDKAGEVELFLVISTSRADDRPLDGFPHAIVLVMFRRTGG